MTIERFGSGGPWEARVGYARAVRAGDHVHVAGCTGVDAEGRVVGDGDLGAQLRQAIANAERGLRLAGATLADVVRTRVYVRDIARWEEAADAHAEAFGAHPPAAAMIEVSRFIDPAMLVEIEVDAWAPR
jgi:enamine deaminase RidA (YjgF/YER057c/UK114 family)